MNPNKTKQLAEKMGWTDGPIGPKPRAVPYFFTDWQENLIKVEGDVGRIWNPESSDADMVELLEKLLKTHPCGFTIHGQGEGFGIVAKQDVYAPTLRAAVVSLACKCWGIEE